MAQALTQAHFVARLLQPHSMQAAAVVVVRQVARAVLAVAVIVEAQAQQTQAVVVVAQPLHLALDLLAAAELYS